MTRIFVYGTLMPGHSRWPILQPYVQGAPIPAAVSGDLYRTPYGWPAAVFSNKSPDQVPGVVVALDAAHGPDALSRLDGVEGTESGLFERRLVKTVDGTPCFAYHWPHQVGGFERLDAWM